MRYSPLAILIVVTAYLLTCVLPRTNHRPSNPKSEKLPVVLRPVNAVIHEKGGLVVNAVESRIKPKQGAPFEFRKAQFVSTNVGWAMTDKSLFKTSNGGQTWERLALNVPDDSHVYSFFFIDESYGWLAILKQIYTERYGLGNSSRIMVTEDGGSSWREQASFPDEVIIKDIRFLNATEGLAIGARVIDQPIDKGPPYDEIFVLSTSDGGKVWSDTSESVKAAMKNDYGIANDIGHYIHWSSTSSTLLLTKYGTVVGTNDRGRTWKKIVEFQDERPNGFVSSTGYYKLVLDTEQRIRVIAGGMGDEGYWGDLVVNGDRDSWTSYELERTPILDAVFLSDNEVVACGLEVRTVDDKRTARLPAVGIILHSLDSGKTWSPIYRSNADETFISLTKVGDGQFYVVSDIGNFVEFNFKGR